VQGYAVVNGLLPQDLVDRVHRDSNALFTSNPQLVGPDFGAIGFPFLTTTYGSLASLNEVPLHPRLLQAVHELLGDEPILLSQAELWGSVNATTDSARNAHARALSCIRLRLCVSASLRLCTLSRCALSVYPSSYPFSVSLCATPTYGVCVCVPVCAGCACGCAANAASRSPSTASSRS
jgi:hypothetical protein